MSTAFTAGEQNWHTRLGKLRDVVRQEVVARQLDRELPPAPVRLVDLGCGQGTQALRLARRGYEVTGVDASPGLLARFERDLAAQPAGVRGRVRVEHGLIEDYAERGCVSPFPAVLCHGVLMYLADPDPDDAEPPPDLQTLLDCEERAGRTDPYRQLAALLHLIARRSG